jgi:hypothetical protein
VALDIGTELISERAGSDCESDLDAHRSAFDLDIAHHSEIDDVGAQLRVDHACKRRPDGFGRESTRVGGSDG